MKPLDPRLLRYARSIRGFLLTQTALGLITTVCVIAFAAVLTGIVVSAIDGTTLTELWPAIGALAGIACVRGLTLWASETVSMRSAGRVKSELRTGVLDAVQKLGPSWLRRRGSASVATLTGRGMDALDEYFAKYLPQLVLTVLVTPILLVVIWWQDWLSGLVILVTLPLIPLFMALIGWATQAVQAKQWAALGELSSGFVDLLGGLATLKIFGRQHRQVTRMREITTRYRTTTMRVLRVTFMSGFVLELAASLSVAIIAVSIGLRMLQGDLSLSIGLFVLLLAPDAFLPLRNVGANFHAAAEGVTAANEAFEILDAARSLTSEPVTESHGTLPEDVALRLDGVRAGHRAADGTLTLLGHEPVSADLRAGTITALVGPSGVGKSSLVARLVGFAEGTGTALLGPSGTALATLAPGERTAIAWSPQRPSLIAGTVRENVALGAQTVDDALVTRALTLAAAAEIAPDTRLGVGGDGLSGGQAQRVGLARAYYRALACGSSLLLLDEPSSALDHDTEARVAAGIRELATTGIAVLLITHRRALLQIADDTLTLAASEPQPEEISA